MANGKDPLDMWLHGEISFEELMEMREGQVGPSLPTGGPPQGGVPSPQAGGHFPSAPGSADGFGETNVPVDPNDPFGTGRTHEGPLDDGGFDLFGIPIGDLLGDAWGFITGGLSDLGGGSALQGGAALALLGQQLMDQRRQRERQEEFQQDILDIVVGSDEEPGVLRRAEALFEANEPMRVEGRQAMMDAMAGLGDSPFIRHMDRPADVAPGTFLGAPGPTQSVQLPGSEPSVGPGTGGGGAGGGDAPIANEEDLMRFADVLFGDEEEENLGRVTDFLGVDSQGRRTARDITPVTPRNVPTLR